ncbi:MAG: hypothetical protein AB7E09_05745 [Candidatus Izemoplasmatales bacterium]
MKDLIQIFIGIFILAIIFFAYAKNNKGLKLVSFVILASLGLTMVLSGMSGLIADIDFLSFFVKILNGVQSIVVYIELGLIAFIVLFSSFKTKNKLILISTIGYVVLTLLLDFGVF